MSQTPNDDSRGQPGDEGPPSGAAGEQQPSAWSAPGAKGAGYPYAPKPSDWPADESQAAQPAAGSPAERRDGDPSGTGGYPPAGGYPGGAHQPGAASPPGYQPGAVPPPPYGAAGYGAAGYGVGAYATPSQPVPTSTVVLLVLSGLATLSCWFTLAGLAPLVLAIVAMSRHRADPAAAARLTRIGWIVFAVLAGLLVLATAGVVVAGFVNSQPSGF